MNWRWIFLVAIFGHGDVRAQNAWLRILSPELRELEAEVTRQKEALEDLGSPMVGQTVAEFGYQHVQMLVPPPESPWIQLDLGREVALSQIALVPALVDFQTVERKAYGFPRRFRVDLSDDPDFGVFHPLFVHTEEDFPDPGAAPVVIDAEGKPARYIRVTVNRLAEENGVHFFALAELIALRGNRNVALGAAVSASSHTHLPPRWANENLVDGRTPLGPPIRRDLLPYDGLFPESSDAHPQAWMMLDLGKTVPIDEIRLQPVHARLGADVPGFNFPRQFRIEASDRLEFGNPAVLFDSNGVDFPNPGNNPVTIQLGESVAARFVRVLMLVEGPGREGSFGLSEIEIYSGDRNIGRVAQVTSSGDSRHRHETRPAALITDGYTSYGSLMELPDWLESWRQRTMIEARIQTLDEQMIRVASSARQRGVWILSGFFLVILSVVAAVYAGAKRRRALEQAAFRDRLAQDLHDEIGSNLAGISVISEMAADHSETTLEDWREVNRIARESNDAMREVLWLVGARQETGIDLMDHLHLAAKRLLSGCEVEWNQGEAPEPNAWDIESRREVFLFFKEALANIVRHSRAKKVTIHAGVSGGSFELSIEDDGCGFIEKEVSRGVGLKSLHDRARRLRGRMSVNSQPGKGTRIVLHAPVHHR